MKGGRNTPFFVWKIHTFFVYLKHKQQLII
jgi:hypothetical protein